MKTIQRHIQPLVLKALKAFPVVYINGPRQAGKTTLVRELLASQFPAKFITFDDALELSAATRNPLEYLRDAGMPLILDEVQMASAIFRPLKILVDEQRMAVLGSKRSANGHYLLTGSANLMVIPELANAMVGRMGTLTLLPLSAGEVMGRKPEFLQRCFAKDFSDIAPDKTPLTHIMAEATYPELLQMPENMKENWLKNYVQKITLEDPRHICRCCCNRSPPGSAT